MNIVIAGASGLIGTELISSMQREGHHIKKLVRNKASLLENEIPWDIEKGVLDTNRLEGCDAIINLAGENIASGRWTESVKTKIKESRVKSTQLIAESIGKLRAPPKVLINASATGIYGDRGEEVLTEDSPGGKGFLAEVCKEWEAATEPASRAGIRVACLRFGMVLSNKGGALQKMLLPFKLGLGGVVGSGQQFISWIAIDDLTRIIVFAIEEERLQGPVNVVTSFPVRNREFTKALGAALHRPTFLPMPVFAARLAFGEMADELLLASARVIPEKLNRQGYQFLYPKIEDAFQYLEIGG